MKRCFRCGLEKDPETEFYRDKTRKDGFSGECKECKKNFNSSRRLESTGHSPQDLSMKLCVKCGVEKDPATEFYKDKTRKDGYTHWCRECVKSYDSSRKKERQAVAKEHYRKNADVYKENARRHRELNPTYQADYYREHPEHAAEGYHRWRARQRGANYKPFKHSDIYRRDQCICQICFQPIDMTLRKPHPLSKTIDHIVPLFMGGDHHPDNVRATHLTCNNKRPRDGSDYLLSVFLQIVAIRVFYRLGPYDPAP